LMALPLKGVRVLELAGLAPAPFCGMVLADFGADVIRVDRVYLEGQTRPFTESIPDPLSRGKRSIAINLKTDEGVEVFSRLIVKADVLIDPFRPGVLEKLGFGPNEMLKSNPRLIIARLTGFGQNGSLSSKAGHDINYLAIAGVLGLFGPNGTPPMFPMNLLADFAGGGLACALGIVLALFERAHSHKGQVIDAAMVDGVAYLSTFVTSRVKLWKTGPRGTNWVDGGAPFYNTYVTSDGKYVALGAIETQFYRAALKGLGFSKEERKELVASQHDTTAWPKMKQIFAARFKEKTRDEWTKVFEKYDACLTPVLTSEEMTTFDHNASRKTFVRPRIPAPAPRLLRTPAVSSGPIIKKCGQHTTEVMVEAGYSSEQINRLVTKGAVERRHDAPDRKSKL